jgi:hypothetical protein
LGVTLFFKGATMQLVKQQGQAALYRKESYNHRTTPLVEWLVYFKDKLVRECATRKEAMTWLDIYKD